jgi:hypothetical protein
MPLSHPIPSADADVRYSHLVDDTEKMRTAALRDANRASDLLADALHALDNGSLDVVREFIERSARYVDTARSTLRITD